MSGLGDLLGAVAPIAGGIGGFLLGGPLGAGAGVAAGGALSGMVGQGNANQANWDNARAQEQFQMNASNTAHQREVADLKSAGLNPILSANAGASTPNGAMAVSQNTMAGNAASAQEIAQMFYKMKEQKAGIDLMGSQKNAADATAVLSKAQAGKAAMETKALQTDATKGDMFKNFLEGTGIPDWLSKANEYRKANANKTPIQMPKNYLNLK